MKQRKKLEEQILHKFNKNFPDNVKHMSRAFQDFYVTLSDEQKFLYQNISLGNEADRNFRNRMLISFVFDEIAKFFQDDINIYFD